MAAADDAIRASDAERDAVVEALRRHMADGRLTMAEFEDRVAEALAARTRRDLDPVLRELPPLEQPQQRDLRRPRRPRMPARAPQIAIMAVVAVAAIVVLSQGAWWMIFPLFWVFGGLANGGACGRGRASRHARHVRHGGDTWREHEPRGTVRV